MKQYNILYEHIKNVGLVNTKETSVAKQKKKHTFADSEKAAKVEQIHEKSFS